MSKSGNASIEEHVWENGTSVNIARIKRNGIRGVFWPYKSEEVRLSSQQLDEGNNQPALSNQGAEHPFQQFDFEVRQAEFEVSFRRQITIEQIDLLFGQGFRLLLGKALLRQVFDESVCVKSNCLTHGQTIGYVEGARNFGSASRGQLPRTRRGVSLLSGSLTRGLQDCQQRDRQPDDAGDGSRTKKSKRILP